MQWSQGNDKNNAREPGWSQKLQDQEGAQAESKKLFGQQSSYYKNLQSNDELMRPTWSQNSQQDPDMMAFSNGKKMAN